MPNNAFNDNHNQTINLPYWDIDDGVMFLMQGRNVEFGIEINPPSSLFMSDSRLRNMWLDVKNIIRSSPVKSRIRIIIASTPTRSEMIDEYLHRKISGDQILQRMIRARHHMFQRARVRGYGYEQRFYVTMSMPVQKIKRGVSLTPDEHRSILERAREQRKQLAERFARAGYQPSILDSQEVFRICWEYLNPEIVSSKPPRFIPMEERTYFTDQVLQKHRDLDMPTARRQMVSSVMSNKSNQYMKIGNTYARVIALKRLPDTSQPNQINRVIQAMGANHYYLILDFEHEPQGPTLRKLGNRLQGFRGALQAEADGRMSQDVSVTVNAQNITDVIAHIKETGDEIFNAAVSMVIYGKSYEHLKEVRDISLGALAELGNTQPIVGTFQNVPMYQQSLLPFGGLSSEFTFKTVELNVSDFFPLAGQWKGSEAMTLLQSRTGGLIKINLFDHRPQNFNAVITGGSGAGKTFLSLTLLRDALAENIEVFVIDRGWGYAPMISAIDGDLISMDPGSGITINPFDLEEGETEPSEERINFVISIVKTMITLSPDPAKAEVEEQILRDAIIQTYEAAILPEPTENDEDQMRYIGTRMSNLVRKLSTIETVGGTSADASTISTAKQLATRLSRWTGNNPEGRVVDGDTNIDINNAAMYFETSGLIANPDIGRVIILLLSDLIFRRFAKNPHGYKIILFDEAWALFDNPEARKLIIELYRRARRYNAAIYSVTQNIGDLLKIDGLIEQCNYFYIGVASGNAEQLQKLPGMEGNDAAINRFEDLRIVKNEYSEFLVWMRTGGDMEGDVAQVVPSGVDLWMFTTNGNDMKRREVIANQKYEGNTVFAALAIGEAEERRLDLMEEE